MKEPKVMITQAEEVKIQINGIKHMKNSLPNPIKMIEGGKEAGLQPFRKVQKSRTWLASWD